MIMTHDEILDKVEEIQARFDSLYKEDYPINPKYEAIRSKYASQVAEKRSKIETAQDKVDRLRKELKRMESERDAYKVGGDKPKGGERIVGGIRWNEIIQALKDAEKELNDALVSDEEVNGIINNLDI